MDKVTDDLRERVARAIEKAAAGFSAPVAAYVEIEAQNRWEADNPDEDFYEVEPFDPELESWKILADAVIPIIRIAALEEAAGIVDEMADQREAERQTLPFPSGEMGSEIVTRVTVLQKAATAIRSRMGAAG